MKTCPYCAFENREGVLFCEECGHPFVGDQKAALATTHLSEQELAGFNGRLAWGTAYFGKATSIVVRIRDHSDAVILEPADELVIGRSDTKSGQTPGLDLGPFGAAEQGVSRQHALIRRGEDTLTLIDLASTNGTFLNGQRLLPKQPRVLRDGDEIRVGRLVFHVFFK